MRPSAVSRAKSSRVLANRLVPVVLDRRDFLRHRVAELIEARHDAAFIDTRDDITGEVKHFLQRTRRHVQDKRERRRHALQVPDVADWRCKLDMPHALAAHLGAGHLDAAAVADDALELDLLVAPAVALPVLLRSKDLLAEQPIALRLERAVVDRLRLLYLAVAPGANLVGRRDTDTNLIKC